MGTPQGKGGSGSRMSGQRGGMPWRTATRIFFKTSVQSIDPVVCMATERPELQVRQVCCMRVAGVWRFTYVTRTRITVTGSQGLDATYDSQMSQAYMYMWFEVAGSTQSSYNRRI